MNLFFTSKTEGAEASAGALPSILKAYTRFEIILHALLSVKQKGFINIVDVKRAVGILENFENEWNKPGRTVASATESIFNFLYVLSLDPKIRKEIPEACLADFFSGIDNLEKCVDFEKLNPFKQNLFTLSADLSYVQLALCFFEAQMHPFWDKPADEFFHNIYKSPDSTALSEPINKLRSLLLLSEQAYEIMESNRAIKANPFLLSTMQGNLKHIRSILLRIIIRESLLEKEEKKLLDEYMFFLKVQHKAGFIIFYLMLTTTRSEKIKKIISKNFASNPQIIAQLQLDFGDEIDLSIADLFLGLDFKDLEPASPLKQTRSLMKGLIDKSDFIKLFEFYFEAHPIEADIKDALLQEDGPSASSLLKEMLCYFDTKKFSEDRPLITKDNILKAIFIHKILMRLFPNVESLVNFFIKDYLAHLPDNRVLFSFMTSYVLSMSVLNNLMFVHEIMGPQAPRKKKIHENLCKVSEHPALFINSFHILYFLSCTLYKSHSMMGSLLDDLNLILEVLRDGGEELSSLRALLVANESRYFPLESTKIIQHLVDKKLWLADQEAKRNVFMVLDKRTLPPTQKSALSDLSGVLSAETDTPQVSVEKIRLSIKHFILKPDVAMLEDFEEKFSHAPPLLMKEALLDINSSSGSSLLQDLLVLFDNKKSSKAQPLVLQDRYTQAMRVDSLLFVIFPNIEDKVNFFVKGSVPANLSHSLLGNFKNSQLILLSVFMNTQGYREGRISREVFKKKIHENLISTLPRAMLFTRIFHTLYYLAYTYAQPHSELQELLEDLNVVLEVLRNAGKQFSVFRSVLMDNEDRDLPLASARAIEHLVDDKLWLADQEAEKLRILLQEKELADGPKKSEPASPSVTNKKKKKKARTPKPGSKAEETSDTFPLSPIQEQKKESAISPVTVEEIQPQVPLSPISELLDTLKPPASVPEESRDGIELVSELNRNILGHLSTLRTEIKACLSGMSPLALAGHNTLIDLDKQLEERQKIITALRAYFKKAKIKKGPIVFTLEELITQSIVVPDWLELGIIRHQELIASLIKGLHLIEKDSVDVPAVIKVLHSVSIPIILLRNIRSFQYLSFFRGFLNTIIQEFSPVLIRALSNEYSHPLGELAVDVKNFAQLMMEVQHWTYSIVTTPFDLYDWDTPRFQFPSERSPIEAVNPVTSLGPLLLNLIQKWNLEINSFAIGLSEVIDSEPESTFKNTMKILIDKLSSSYFKSRVYPTVALVNRLFSSYSKIELYGTQLYMKDPVCDIDVRLKWHKKDASIQEVIAHLVSVLRQMGAPKTVEKLVCNTRTIHNSNGTSVVVFKINIPSGEVYSLPLDLSIYVADEFPLVSYASHAAAILDTRTGRISCPHDFFKSILKGELLIKDPVVPDFSEKSKYSRLAHVIKLTARAAYCDLPERLALSDSATKMLTLLKTTKLSALKEVRPDLVEALNFLIKQHMEHYELTSVFFKRTSLLLEFYKDIGCTLVVRDGPKKLQLSAVNTNDLHLICKFLPESDVGTNSFFVGLPKELLKRVGLIPQVSLGIFSPGAVQKNSGEDSLSLSPKIPHQVTG